MHQKFKELFPGKVKNGNNKSKKNYDKHCSSINNKLVFIQQIDLSSENSAGRFLL